MMWIEVAGERVLYGWSKQVRPYFVPGIWPVKNGEKAFVNNGDKSGLQAVNSDDRQSKQKRNPREAFQQIQKAVWKRDKVENRPVQKLLTAS